MSGNKNSSALRFNKLREDYLNYVFILAGIIIF